MHAYYVFIIFNVRLTQYKVHCKKVIETKVILYLVINVISHILLNKTKNK